MKRHKGWNIYSTFQVPMLVLCSGSQNKKVEYKSQKNKANRKKLEEKWTDRKIKRSEGVKNKDWNTKKKPRRGKLLGVFRLPRSGGECRR